MIILAAPKYPSILLLVTRNPLHCTTDHPSCTNPEHAFDDPPSRCAFGRWHAILRPQTSPPGSPPTHPTVPSPATRPPQIPRSGNARAWRQIHPERIPRASHHRESGPHHRVLDGMADVRAAGRRRFVARREDGSRQGGQDEWRLHLRAARMRRNDCVYRHLFLGELATGCSSNDFSCGLSTDAALVTRRQVSSLLWSTAIRDSQLQRCQRKLVPLWWNQIFGRILLLEPLTGAGVLHKLARKSLGVS
nr:hypothetical protein CFP56_19300 [Quercus suber]